MNSFRKHFFPAPICSSLVSHLHNSVRNSSDTMRKERARNITAQPNWSGYSRERERRENCRVNRPLRTRIAASGDARGPSFPLNLYFLSYAQATLTQSGVFYAAPSHAVQGLPFVSLPLVPPDPPAAPLVLFHRRHPILVARTALSQGPRRALSVPHLAQPRILFAYACVCTCIHRVSSNGNGFTLLHEFVHRICVRISRIVGFAIYKQLFK